jgi:glycerophosphoryl diester phosphodiesterase
MAAFDLAVGTFRTDMLELDVRITGDGELVVIHDDTLDRTTDEMGKVCELALRDLEKVDAGHHFCRDGEFPYRGKGVRIPRLEQVLRAYPRTLFNIEVKDDVPSIEEGFADVVRRAGALARVCVGSENDALSKRLLRTLPDACHFYPRSAVTNMIIGLRAGATPREDDPYDVLDIPLYYGGARLVDTQFLFRAARIGRWVNVWTIDDPGEMRRLMDEQVGGIMTDRPDLLRRVLDRQALG